MSDARVPRDQAFWNTYNDVQQELTRAQTKIECTREGHIMELRGTNPPQCRCGMTPIKAAESMGFNVEQHEDGSYTIKF